MSVHHNILTKLQKYICTNVGLTDKKILLTNLMPVDKDP